MKKYRICTNCVMDTSDPSIIFDKDGICSHCNSFYSKTLPYWNKLLNENSLADLKKDINLRRSNQKVLTIVL